MSQAVENKKIPSASPFIKWAGGKSQLLPQILNRIPDEYNNYFEPFIGGGAVFYALNNTLHNTLNPKKAFISDFSKDLITTYKTVRDKPEILAEELSSYEYNEEFYYKLRELDRDQSKFKKLSELQVAARFIYLNKTCFNGLYRVNSKGQFNVPFGKYKNPSFFKIENLKACSKALLNADIKHQDYKAILEKVNKKDLIYLDPPYSPLNKTSSFTSYTKDGFNNEKQIELRNFCIDLDKKGAKFLLSNSYTTLILDLYKDFRIEALKAKRAINSNAKKRNSINEVLISNY